MLRPHKEQREQPFWKLLESEPSEERFAFQYDPTHSKKKQQKDDNDEEEKAEQADDVPNLTLVQLELVADAAAKKMLIQLRGLLEEYHKKLVDDVADKVTTNLLERAPHDMEQHDLNRNNYDNWGPIDQIVQVYAEDGKSVSTCNNEDEPEKVASAQEQSP